MVDEESEWANPERLSRGVWKGAELFEDGFRRHQGDSWVRPELREDRYGDERSVYIQDN